MAQLNTQQNDNTIPENALPDPMESVVRNIHTTLKDAGITTGLLIFRFPDDKDGAFRTIRLGHFYDSLQMLSEYCKKAKTRIMEDLDGIN